VWRDADGLATARAALAPLAFGNSPQADPAMLALMMVHAMQARRESRGGHTRTDYPGKWHNPERTSFTWNVVRAAMLETHADRRSVRA
jgi:L-aspartate oxidase